MSAAWFDYDGDGRPDLYVSNMWTAPGQRLVADRQLLARGKDGLAEAYRRHTKGNSLYRNRGDGTFEETGSQENVEMGRWAWSADGFDFDNDGAPEIYIACGMLTNAFGGRRDELLLAAGGGEFAAVASRRRQATKTAGTPSISSSARITVGTGASRTCFMPAAEDATTIFPACPASISPTTAGRSR